MGRSVRIYCLDSEGRLFSVPLTLAESLSRGDARIHRFRGRHIRFAELAVELEDRRPVAVGRTVFYRVRFDARGGVDRLRQQQELRAISASALSSLGLDDPVGDAVRGVVEKGAEFVARGRAWRPGPEQCAQLEAAVYGEIHVRRLRAD